MPIALGGVFGSTAYKDTGTIMAKRSKRSPRNIAKSRTVRLACMRGQRVVELTISDRYGMRTLKWSMNTGGYYVRKVETEVPVVKKIRTRESAEVIVNPKGNGTALRGMARTPISRGRHSKGHGMKIRGHHTVPAHRDYKGGTQEVYSWSETTTRTQRFEYTRTQLEAYLNKYGCSLN